MYVYGCNWAYVKEVATVAGHFLPDPPQNEVDGTEADNGENLEGLDNVDWDDWDDGDNPRRKRMGYDVVKLIGTRRQLKF